MAKLRVLLADDHPLMIAAVRSALESEKDFEIVGEATSGSQVMPLVSSARPDVVLIDLRLPEIDGLTCLERICAKHPTVRVVLFSGVDDREQIAVALERGACAYLVKSIHPGDLAAVIRQAVAGSFFCAVRLGHGYGTLRERRRRPERARDGDPLRCSPGPLQPCDRQGAVALGPDGQVPPAQHLPQARGGESNRGREVRLRPRPRRGDRGRLALPHQRPGITRQGVRRQYAR